jgi:hypothetical protein
VHFADVIYEIDIWRAAQLMLKRDGEPPSKESAACVGEAPAGDHKGPTTWRRIMAALTQLANNTPPCPGVLYVIIGFIECCRELVSDREGAKFALAREGFRNCGRGGGLFWSAGFDNAK